MKPSFRSILLVFHGARVTVFVTKPGGNIPFFLKPVFWKSVGFWPQIHHSRPITDPTAQISLEPFFIWPFHGLSWTSLAQGPFGGSLTPTSNHFWSLHIVHRHPPKSPCAKEVQMVFHLETAHGPSDQSLHGPDLKLALGGQKSNGF
jgi:hypothetical protein